MHEVSTTELRRSAVASNLRRAYAPPADDAASAEFAALLRRLSEARSASSPTRQRRSDIDASAGPRSALG